MPGLSINAPVVKKTVSVQFSAVSKDQRSRAILLGASGEQLRTFSLTEEVNELSLDGFAPGVYTIRVEAGNEVVAKQIIIP